MQTMFSVAGNFTKVDEVLYERWVCTGVADVRTYLRTLDGGTL